MTRPLVATLLFVTSLGLLRASSPPRIPATPTVTVHGHSLTLHVYGERGRPAVLLASGDGGWTHVAPRIAEWLAARGYYVVGLDSRAYLSRGSNGEALTVDAIPADYLDLLRFLPAGSTPLLAGVSEGAGLSVATAVDPAVASRITGVIAIGLGDRNELAWHWRDAVIYITKNVPNEPLFDASTLLPRVKRPFAMIRATHDEFVPQAESDRLFLFAHDPKRLWTVPASNHSFTDNNGGLDDSVAQAIRWIASLAPHA